MQLLNCKTHAETRRLISRTIERCVRHAVGKSHNPISSTIGIARLQWSKPAASLMLIPLEHSLNRCITVQQETRARWGPLLQLRSAVGSVFCATVDFNLSSAESSEERTYVEPSARLESYVDWPRGKCLIVKLNHMSFGGLGVADAPSFGLVRGRKQRSQFSSMLSAASHLISHARSAVSDHRQLDSRPCRSTVTG